MSSVSYFKTITEEEILGRLSKALISADTKKFGIAEKMQIISSTITDSEKKFFVKNKLYKTQSLNTTSSDEIILGLFNDWALGKVNEILELSKG